MDLIAYLLILVAVGFARVNKTAMISDEVGIVETGATIVEPAYEDIPIGQNLALLKEEGAYTLILEELGLMRC